MDYVVGGVAALLTGNVTPNRPKLLRKALTPTKRQPSPNVTPKSEFVDDRSIFMSPTLQKKKAVLKKSPKRIFQNPDLDVTNDGEGITVLASPKAEKVKKHLKNELEGDSMITTSLLSPKSPKGNKNKQSKSLDVNQSKKSKKNILDSNELQENAEKQEITPKKKKREALTEIFSDKENATEESVVESSKKSKKKRKLISESNDADKNDSLTMEPIDDNAELSPKKKKDKIPEEDSAEKPNVTKNNKISKAKRRRERKKAIKTKLIKLGKLAAPDPTLKNVNAKKSKNKINESSISNNQNAESDDDKLVENSPTVKKNKNKTKKSQEKINDHVSDAENESDEQETNKTSNQEETRKNKKHKLVKKQPIKSQESDSEDDTKIEEESIKANKVQNKKTNKSMHIETEDSGNNANMEDEESKPDKMDTTPYSTKTENSDSPVEKIQKTSESKTKKKKKKTKSEINNSESDPKLHELLQAKPFKKNKPTKTENFENSDSDSVSKIQKTLESKPVKKSTIKVNPNAITDQNTDSEHESDNEIESENEQINEKILKTEQSQENSSSEDDEQQETVKSQKKQPTVDKTAIDDPEVIKRTLFVGNVPFSKKCKKEIKSLFCKYGQIETVRIRTVPVKDGRVTPKMAVIKNELHPDRTTVNVYVKFSDPDSVEKALAENNTVLNEHHLRVSRSDQSGAHDSAHAVFVGNLPFAIEDEGLRAVFDKCGEINSVRIVRDRATNAGKGFGYVNFASRDGVELALSLSEEDLTIKNRIIRVKRCTQFPQKIKNQGKHGNQNQGDNRKFQGNVQGRNQGGKFQDRNQGTDRFQDRKQGGNFQPRNQGGNFQSRNQSGNFQQRNQGGNFQQRDQGGNFQQRNQGGNFQQRNQGGNFQQRDQGGNFQQRNQGGNFQQRNQGGGFRERSEDGKGRGQGNRQRQGDTDTQFEGAIRRLNKKRQNQELTDGPANKVPKADITAVKEKKPKQEFVGMTADKKKKHKFDKGLKKKKKLSEILMKKNVEA